ncbi:protein translocase subunit SecF [Striga asiatica]|uniref:Protein translocase subunit SecF n=1 Tax=Striga asiatica TaxID=4170 RepID=A0A5A7Q0R9_STRAF|nr:protein translocase subunit SecF [Striga asiatica]
MSRTFFLLADESISTPKKSNTKAEPCKPCNRKEISISEPNNVKPATVTAQTSQKADTSGVQKAEILIRFPKGDKREHGFLCTDKALLLLMTFSPHNFLPIILEITFSHIQKHVRNPRVLFYRRLQVHHLKMATLLVINHIVLHKTPYFVPEIPSER